MSRRGNTDVDVYRVSLLSDESDDDDADANLDSNFSESMTGGKVNEKDAIAHYSINFFERKPSKLSQASKDGNVFERLYNARPLQASTSPVDTRITMNKRSTDSSVSSPLRFGVSQHTRKNSTPSQPLEKENGNRNAAKSSDRSSTPNPKKPQERPKPKPIRIKGLSKISKYSAENTGHGSSNIRVIIRCCPARRNSNGHFGSVSILSKEEIEIIAEPEQEDTSVSFILPAGPKRFAFDRVFDGAISQKVVFDELSAVIEHFVRESQSGSIIAYGQTGTGKTYSMGLESTPDNTQELGIVPRAITRIFRDISSLSLSVFEIYLNQLYDLMTDDDNFGDSKVDETYHGSLLNTTLLSVRERDGRVVVPTMTKTIVSTPQVCWDLVRSACQKRQSRETAMNKLSSRSHMIVALTLPGDAATLTFVDLAGCERLDYLSQSANAREAGFINSSLASLGKVIRALACEHSTFVPFRDCKLTRMLQSSLTKGNVAMLCTVSPEPSNVLETLSTLQFAARCSRVSALNAMKQGTETLHDGSVTEDLYKHRLNSMCNRVSDLMEDGELGRRLSDFGISQDDFDHLVDKTFKVIEHKIKSGGAAVTKKDEVVDVEDGASVGKL